MSGAAATSSEGKSKPSNVLVFRLEASELKTRRKRGDGDTASGSDSRSVRSDKLTVDGIDFRMLVFPRGTRFAPKKGGPFLSCFLEVQPDTEHWSPSWCVRDVQFCLSLVNPRGDKNHPDAKRSVIKRDTYTFTSKQIDRGWHDFCTHAMVMNTDGNGNCEDGGYETYVDDDGYLLLTATISSIHPDEHLQVSETSDCTSDSDASQAPPVRGHDTQNAKKSLKARLRKKLDERKANKSAGGSGGAAADDDDHDAAFAAQQAEADLLAMLDEEQGQTPDKKKAQESNANKKKKNKKKKKKNKEKEEEEEAIEDRIVEVFEDEDEDNEDEDDDDQFEDVINEDAGGSGAASPPSELFSSTEPTPEDDDWAVAGKKGKKLKSAAQSSDTGSKKDKSSGASGAAGGSGAQPYLDDDDDEEEEEESASSSEGLQTTTQRATSPKQNSNAKAGVVGGGNPPPPPRTAAPTPPSTANKKNVNNKSEQDGAMQKRLDQTAEALKLAHEELAVMRERVERAERSRIERTEELETKLRERTTEIEKLQKQSDKTSKKESNILEKAKNAQEAADKRATEAAALSATLRRENNGMQERLATALSKNESLEAAANSAKESTAADTEGTPTSSISQFVPADLTSLDLEGLLAVDCGLFLEFAETRERIMRDWNRRNEIPPTEYYIVQRRWQKTSDQLQVSCNTGDVVSLERHRQTNDPSGEWRWATVIAGKEKGAQGWVPKSVFLPVV